MSPKLYCSDPNPGVRAIYMTAEVIGLHLEKKFVNMALGEHLTPEFLKMNPQHTVPTLQDGDFIIWDSHAINSYLIDKYAPNDSLYPKDLKKRALVDQKLHFDSGVLFPRLSELLTPVLKQGAKSLNQHNIDAVIEAYKLLEALLPTTKYLTGSELTVADFAVSTTTVMMDLVVPLEEKHFPKTHLWLETMKALPYFEKCNENGLSLFKNMLKEKLG